MVKLVEGIIRSLKIVLEESSSRDSRRAPNYGAAPEARGRTSQQNQSWKEWPHGSLQVERSGVQSAYCEFGEVANYLKLRSCSKIKLD